MKRLNFKKGALLTFIAGILIAGNAFAVCNVTGKIGRVYSTQAGSSDYSWFYIVPETSNPYTGTYSYAGYVYGDDTALHTNLTSANAANLTVYCQTAASTCPTTGTTRNVGAINYCYTYQNR